MVHGDGLEDVFYMICRYDTVDVGRNDNMIKNDFDSLLKLLYIIIFLCILSSFAVIPLERLFCKKEHELLDLCKTFER